MNDLSVDLAKNRHINSQLVDFVGGP